MGISYFLRQIGTNNYIKFQPKKNGKLFGQGSYYLGEGLFLAAVFDHSNANSLIKQAKTIKINLEAVMCEDAIATEKTTIKN